MSDSEPLVGVTSRGARMTFRIGTQVLAILGFVLACAAFGMAIYAVVRINDDLNHADKVTRGLSSHAVITGSNPTKNDVNVKHNLYVGRNAIVNNTIYARDGIVSASGSASFNQSITSNYGDITAEHGQVSAECVNEYWNYNVSAYSDVSIAVGDVVSVVNGYVRLGFGQMHDSTVASALGSQAQNIFTINLSATRVVNLYLDSTNALVFQLVELNTHTLEWTVYTSYAVGLPGVFTNDFSFVGVGIDGDDSRFLVLYTDPDAAAGSQSIQAAGVQIVSTAYPTVTFTSDVDNDISDTAQTNPCVSDVKFLYGNTYAAWYTDDTGLRVRAFTVVPSTWTFTLGTVQSVPLSQTGFTGGNKCFVASAAVLSSTSSTAYVAVSYGGGDTNVDINVNVMTISGLTWTAIVSTGPTVDAAPGVGSRHQVVALPTASGTQFGVAIQASADLIEGKFFTYNVVLASLVCSNVDVDGLPAFTFNYYEGYFVSLFSNPPFQVVNLGGSSTEQKLAVCWQSNLPTRSAIFCQPYTLDAGVYSGSGNLIAASAYGPGVMALASTNSTTFTFFYSINAEVSTEFGTLLRFGVVSVDDDGQLQVSRSKGSFPVGIAHTAADPGDALVVQISGCRTDATAYDYESAVELCLHGDGTIQPNSYAVADVTATYQPVCNCVHLSGGTIMCDRPFGRSAKSPYANTI